MSQMTTKIPSDLLKAYKRTDFIVYNRNDFFILSIGKRSMNLDKLMKTMEINSACFITAWNPFSKDMTPVLYESKQSKLIKYVKQQGYSYLHGIGRSKDHKYHEDSILILDCSMEFSKYIGKKFKQNAVVHYEAGSTAELILLR